MASTHGSQTFETIARIYHESAHCTFEKVDIDMGDVTWFEADLCAPLGAILYSISEALNTVTLVNMSQPLKVALARNAFLSYYGSERIPDGFGTTIEYKRFEVKDDRYFAEYIEYKLMHHTEMPNMSDGLAKKFRESIFEIFNNAVTHSETKHGIFSCGQYFPKKHLLKFTIADLGVGIPKNVRKINGLDQLTAAETIDWATRENHTTKRGKVPGGLGLKLIKEFIDKNGGTLQIVSDFGIWEFSGGSPRLALMKHPFPGTFVRIWINTADTKSYEMTSERKNFDIF